jgi:hypothetical protein
VCWKNNVGVFVGGVDVSAKHLAFVVPVILVELAALD